MVCKVFGSVILSVFLLLAPSVFATTYYVDPVVGSDTNSGTSISAAWKHIPGSLTTSPSAKISAGDIILVKGGSFQNDSITIDSTHYNNGQAGSTIQIRSGHLSGWGTGRAVIDGKATPSAGAGTWGKGFWISSRSYIRIEGFEIRNMANVGDSAGIWIDGAATYNEIVDNLIHEIYGSLGSSGYGIEVTGTTLASYNLIEKNEIYHCEEKCIELYRQGNCTIRSNNLYQSNEHVVVITSKNNEVYGNIIRQAGFAWMTYLDPGRPSFGLKCEPTSTVPADNNIVYNNIVWDCCSGLGIMGSYNRFHHNTVYYTGYQSNISGGYEGSAFVLRPYGSTKPTGNDIRNNIFYYSALIYSNAATVAINTAIGSSNIISRNAIYRDSATVSSLTYWREGSAESWHTVNWLEGPSGFTTIATGNVATFNVVLDPEFKGGRGASILPTAPTGFDSSWHPNKDGLSLGALTPLQVLQGDPLGAPFNTDVLGSSRTAYSLGAYEQTGVAAQPPDPPVNLRIK
jgi:parallel beta-helix repeat protein